MGRRMALLRMLGLAVPARYGTLGQYRRRPDQISDPPPSAVAPTQAAGILRARTVIVFGTGPGVGFFEYNGTPSASNPPVAYAAPPGTTKDPFGNVLPSSLGGFTAVAAFLFAQLRAAQLLLGSTNASTRITSPGTVTLADALTDGATPSLSITAPSTASGSQAQLTVTGESTNAFVRSQIIVGAPAAAPSTGALFEVQGTQGFPGIATPVSAAAGTALMFSDTNGFERMLAGLAGDTDAYQIGEFVQILGGTFTINNTVAQTIFTKALGIGNYTVDIWGVYSNSTAADSAGFAFAFTGTASLVLVDYTSMTTGTAVVGYLASSTLTTQFNGQGQAGNQQLRATLTIIVSAAGTLTFTGKELVAANTVAVFGGSRMRVRHWS